VSLPFASTDTAPGRLYDLRFHEVFVHTGWTPRWVSIFYSPVNNQMQGNDRHFDTSRRLVFFFSRISAGNLVKVFENRKTIHRVCSPGCRQDLPRTSNLYSLTIAFHASSSSNRTLSIFLFLPSNYFRVLVLLYDSFTWNVRRPCVCHARIDYKRHLGRVVGPSWRRRLFLAAWNAAKYLSWLIIEWPWLWPNSESWASWFRLCRRWVITH
jgi:hypothetical protein